MLGVKLVAWVTGTWQTSQRWPKTACDDDMGPEEKAVLPCAMLVAPNHTMARASAAIASHHCQARMGDMRLK